MRTSKPRKRKPIKHTRIVDALSSKHFTVLIDSNEGNRIPFPATMRWRPLGARRSSLLTIGSRVVNLGRLSQSRGDIALEGYTHVTAIERKGGMAELWHNVRSGKLVRQLTTLRGLVKFPYLLLDISLPQMYGTGKNASYREEDPTPAVLDTVIAMANDLGVPIIGPISGRGSRTRIILGEYLIRVMLSHVKGKTYVPYRTIQLRAKRGC